MAAAVVSVALSFAQVRSLVAGGADLSGCVLVGGQALNYWADYFEITEYGAALSEDIDFFGSAESAVAFANAVGGKVRVAGPEDVHSPNTALVIVALDGEDQVIDFLGSLKGFSFGELRRVLDWAVTVRVAEPEAGTLAVMHPVHCLTSQLENVYGTVLNRRDSPQGQRAMERVQLAIESCWYTTIEQLDGGKSGRRNAFRIVEKVHKLSLLASALRALEEDGVDITESIPVEHLAAEFRDQRWPRLVQERAAALDKYRRRRTIR